MRAGRIPLDGLRGHSRTSTYLADTVRILCNIVDNFKAGETYNIGGDSIHTIEELSDVVLSVTGAHPSLVRYAESEILTTTTKRADISKSLRDLDHQNAYSLEDGMRITADWMRQTHDIRGGA